MAQTTVLAKELARRKDEDLKNIALKLSEEICKLATINYRDSSIVFNFDAGFFKTAPFKMTIPKEFAKKVKRAKKQQKASSVKLIEDSKMTKGGTDVTGLTEAEALYVYIVNTFNNIERTMNVKEGKSKEQEIILFELKDLLQQESFKVKIEESYMEINWW